jgi:hypothetical protein
MRGCIAEAFKSYGVATEAVWGDDPHRAAKVAAVRTGDLKVAVNCALLTEGFDAWQISCIVMARPTQSESLYTQMIGRATRIPDGIGNLNEARARGEYIPKEDCLIMDMVDVTTKHSLVTMPSLFGMNPAMDLKGRGVVKTVQELEALKHRKPTVDFTRVTEVDQLEAYAEQVDLLKVDYAPEIIQISQFMWHKTGEAYVLLLMGGESMTVLPDILNRWHIVGKINGCDVHDRRDTFEEAIREADAKVQIFGGRGTAAVAKRTLKKDGCDPSPAQLMLCQRLKIPVPPGATFGDIRRKLNQVIEERGWRRTS